MTGRVFSSFLQGTWMMSFIADPGRYNAGPTAPRRRPGLAEPPRPASAPRTLLGTVTTLLATDLAYLQRAVALAAGAGAA